MNQLILSLVSVLSLAPGAPDTENLPAPRWGHVLVYDSARDELLLFGGAPDRGVFVNDTWTWKDGTWTRRSGEAPAARGFAAGCFDPSSGTVVLHGGRGNDRVTYSDTWSWDGHNWIRLEAGGGWQVDHHQVVWDRARHQLIGFGGWTGSAVADETRFWDGHAWVAIPGSAPPPRASFGMAYDGDREKVVLYGGLWVNGQYADSWLWDGVEWAAHTGPYDDSSLDHHSMVWDEERKELLLFGGKDYRYQLSGRTRTLSGKTWVERSRDGPSPRHDEMATRAIELDADLPEAQTALGLVKVFQDWDWDAAEAHVVPVP